jgi:hypothetical protein
MERIRSHISHVAFSSPSLDAESFSDLSDTTRREAEGEGDSDPEALEGLDSFGEARGLSCRTDGL